MLGRGGGREGVVWVVESEFAAPPMRLALKAALSLRCFDDCSVLFLWDVVSAGDMFGEPDNSGFYED